MFGIFSRDNILAAAERGDTKKLKVLIEEKGVDVNVRSEEGLTPLHAAAIGGHVGAARLLLEKGADINARTKDNGFTPLGLVFTAKKGAAEMAKLLIEYGADVNDRTMDGVPILHIAALEGKVELVDALIEQGADVNIRDINRATPLYAAIAGRQIRIVKQLLEKGADINARAKLHPDVAGGLGDLEATPLQAALMEGYNPVARFLIEKGADVTATRRDETGRLVTTLELALELGNSEMADMIRQTGGRSTRESGNELDSGKFPGS